MSDTKVEGMAPTQRLLECLALWQSHPFRSHHCNCQRAGTLHDLVKRALTLVTACSRAGKLFKSIELVKHGITALQPSLN